MENNRMKLPLFDDSWIDFRTNTKRRWFAPEVYSQAPSGAYSSLIYDPERQVYRLYYEVLIDPALDACRGLKLVESKDLKTFTPVYADDGSEYIFTGGAGIHGSSVLYDPFDPDPSRRYKLCGMTRMDRKGLPKEVEITFSADGIHFEDRHDVIAHPYTSDTLNKLFYNPLKDEYTLTLRSAHVDRRISIKSSKDLKEWTHPRIILHPGSNYSDGVTHMMHYAMSPCYMDGIFYGLLWRYNTSLYDMDFTRMSGYMEPELVYSYDGQEFLYTSGKPLMERPVAPNPGCAGLAPHDMCESIDGKSYFIYCSAGVRPHGTATQNYERGQKLKELGINPANLIYKIRKDGFCGLEGVCYGAQIITKPISFLEADLSFNINAACGTVRFALLEKYGEPIEGFSFDDCIPFEYDDSVDVRPKWKEHDFSEMVGKQLRVAVELNGAILHCISGTARPHVRQAQKSFADPIGSEDYSNGTTRVGQTV